MNHQPLKIHCPPENTNTLLFFHPEEGNTNQMHHQRQFLFQEKLKYPGSRIRSKTAHGFNGLGGFLASFERFERFFFEKTAQTAQILL